MEFVLRGTREWGWGTVGFVRFVFEVVGPEVPVQELRQLESPDNCKEKHGT